ncbi:siderophore-binding protein DesE [Rhodococcus baikonurensis]
MTTLLTPRPHRCLVMDWNRRRFLGAAAGLAASLAVAGCSRSGADDGGVGDAGWSFTDDRGNLIELDSPPRTFVAYTGIAGALWDYGLVPVGVFGALTRSLGSTDTSISGNLDFSKTDMVGQLWGQVELEKIAALEPDVVIVPQLRGSALLDEANLDAVKGLSSVLFVETATGNIDSIVQDIVQLAVELGADQDLEAQREDYRAARERISEVASSLKKSPVLFVSADPDTIRVSRSGFPILADLTGLGLAVVDPAEGSSVYVEKLAWEMADHYPADMIFLDDRPSSLQLDSLGTNPAWSNLPAVKAGKVGTWNPEPVLSYAGIARTYNSLADQLLAFSHS